MASVAASRSLSLSVAQAVSGSGGGEPGGVREGGGVNACCGVGAGELATLTAPEAAAVVGAVGGADSPEPLPLPLLPRGVAGAEAARDAGCVSTAERGGAIARCLLASCSAAGLLRSRASKCHFSMLEPERRSRRRRRRRRRRTAVSDTARSVRSRTSRFRAATPCLRALGPEMGPRSAFNLDRARRLRAVRSPPLPSPPPPPFPPPPSSSSVGFGAFRATITRMEGG